MRFLSFKMVLCAASVGMSAFATSLCPPVSARQITAEVVMSGLNNPRGIAVGADGGVYVTEAGTGAFGTGNANPVSVVAASGATEFYGTTGSVSRYLSGLWVL